MSVFGFVKQIQGWAKIKGASDGTMIGNTSDSLKSHVTKTATADDISASGSLGALNATLIVPIHGISNVVFNVVGTWVGTIQVYGSVDGGTLYGNALNLLDAAGFVTSLTTNGVRRLVTASGYTHLKFQMTAYTSGTANLAVNGCEPASANNVYQSNHALLLGTQYLKGATDNTLIGNILARLTTENLLNVVNRQDVSTGARTVSSQSATLDSYGFGSITATLNVTAASGTLQTLDVVIEQSDDQVNWRPAYSFERVNAASVKFARAHRIATRWYRYNWTVGGSSPSFTFTIDTTLKHYLAPPILSYSQYAGLDLTNTANTSVPVNVEGLNDINIITVRGADGGNNGQWYIEGSNEGLFWYKQSANITQGASSVLSTAVSFDPFKLMRLHVQAATNVGTRVLDLHWAGA